MAWTNWKLFNFYGTAGYVSPAANTENVEFVTAYPNSATIDGDTFDYGNTGGDAAAGDVDRDNSGDPRLAGIGYANDTGECVWRLDLPSAGDYEIDLALGDALFGQDVEMELRDTSTVLLSFGPTTTSAGEFVDASGVLRTDAADWVANHATVGVTFSTQILNVALITPDAGASPIAHLAIRRAGSTGTSGRKALMGVGR